GDKEDEDLRAARCDLAAYSFTVGARKLDNRIAQGWEKHNFYYYISCEPPVLPSPGSAFPVELPPSANRIPFAETAHSTTDIELKLLQTYFGAEEATSFRNNGYKNRRSRSNYDKMLRRLVSDCQAKVQCLVVA